MEQSLFNPPAKDYADRYGDSWEYCYCDIYGNSVVSGSIVRTVHRVYAISDHKCPIVYGRDYKEMVDRDQFNQKSIVSNAPSVPIPILIPFLQYPKGETLPTVNLIFTACIQILSLHKNLVMSNTFSTFDYDGILALTTTLGAIMKLAEKDCLIFNRMECYALVKRCLCRLESMRNVSGSLNSNIRILQHAKSLLELDLDNQSVCKRLSKLMTQ